MVAKLTGTPALSAIGSDIVRGAWPRRIGAFFGDLVTDQWVPGTTTVGNEKIALIGRGRQRSPKSPSAAFRSHIDSRRNTLRRNTATANYALILNFEIFALIGQFKFAGLVVSKAYPTCCSD